MALMTIIAAFIGYAVIPNFPAKATFLNEEERQLVQDRINVDRRDFENEHLTKAGVFKALGDWKIWAMVGSLAACHTFSRLNGSIRHHRDFYSSAVPSLHTHSRISFP